MTCVQLSESKHGFFFVTEYIFVDLGYKADGVIPRGEFSYGDEKPQDKLKVGQKVYILDQVGEIVSIRDRQPVVSSFSLVDGEYEYTLINEMRPIDFLVK